MESTGKPTPVRRQDESKQFDLLQVVDPAALALAAVAASIAFLLGSGDWTPITLLVGATLTMVVFAYHRGVPAAPRLRNLVGRGAFGGVASLAICLTVAWPAQFLVFWMIDWCDISKGRATACEQALRPLTNDNTPGGITTALLTPVGILLAFWLALREESITARLNPVVSEPEENSIPQVGQASDSAPPDDSDHPAGNELPK